MDIKEYRSFTFIIDDIGIIIEAPDKLTSIAKFAEEYRHLFNKKWVVVQNTISHKINNIEEKYL